MTQGGEKMAGEVPMVCVTCGHRCTGLLDQEELRCPQCHGYVVFDSESYDPPKRRDQVHYSDHHLNSPFFAPLSWMVHSWYSHRRHYENSRG